jgi:hypothetical protein
MCAKALYGLFRDWVVQEMVRRSGEDARRLDVEQPTQRANSLTRSQCLPHVCQPVLTKHTHFDPLTLAYATPDRYRVISTSA